MAYNAVAQGDPDVFSDSPTSYHSISNLAQSRNLEHSGGSPDAHAAFIAANRSGARIPSMIRSMTSAGSDYDLVEDDDYDRAETRSNGHPPSQSDRVRYHRRTSASESGHYDPIQLPKRGSQKSTIRTVSREGSIPMRHPTPDLQSLQGAYLGNVERLERSAERLSMSSDIGEELRKISLEQKRLDSRRSSMLNTHVEDDSLPPVRRNFSSSSNASNSILRMNSAARSGGFSPGGYITSPRVSLRSGSWSHNSIQGRSASYKSRFAQMPEPELEGKPLDSPIPTRSIPVISSPKPPMQVLRVINHDEVSHESPALDQEYGRALPAPHANHGPVEPASEILVRSTTSSSVNTDALRKADNLFADFDGVHITTAPHRAEECFTGDIRPPSLGHPPVVPRPQSYAAPPTGENMVFYPAPVPMTLNLPQKLSKVPPASQREKRRSHLLGNASSEARKSTALLPEVLETANEGNQDDPDSASPKGNVESRKSIPPQLRASVFFEHPGLPQTIQVKENSAVATLDSILEASAYAPISAFTDHPIAGPIGAEIYSNSTATRSSGNLLADKTEHRKSRSSLNLLNERPTSSYIPTIEKRDSSLLADIALHLKDPDMLDEAEAAAASGKGTPLRRMTPGRDGIEGDGGSYNAQESFEGQEDRGLPTEEFEYNGVPTTLLAELQLRQAQQKQRNRTAASAFPNGMHSTLLELDAVAQVLKQTRQQKRITLAWEDLGTYHPGAANEDDEDVPLGVLFPGRKIAANVPQPVGLVQRRDIDDNEPLSQRRARLRGDGPAPQQNTSPGKRASMYTLEIPGLPATHNWVEKSAEEGETLAQRIKRLKGQTDLQARPISGDFANEVLSHFGGLLEPSNQDPSKHPSKAANAEEETLAQRRKRLQAERKAETNQASSSAGPPAAARPPVLQRRSTTDLLQTPPALGQRAVSNKLIAQDSTMPAYINLGPSGGIDVHHLMGRNSPISLPRTPQFGALPTPTSYNPPFPTVDRAAFPLDMTQRDMIDRWRLSVMN
ncbi:hypothetical protein MMC08_004637 [Hypocenomyce scalaris]|nr:hypothetical protein [Hypocenomyce scalaris]